MLCCCTHPLQSGLNYDLIVRFIEMQALLMLPITPHLSEYIWTDLLHKVGLARASSYSNKNGLERVRARSATYCGRGVASSSSGLTSQRSS